MKNGFVKIALSAPYVNVANPGANAKTLVAKIAEAYENGAKVLLFPELCLTGYSCGDLFFQRSLLDGALSALDETVKATRGKKMLVFVGLPLDVRGCIYNCAVAISDGRILGVTPKRFLPNYREFSEKRWFTEPTEDRTTVRLLGQEVPFGVGLVYRCEEMPELGVGCEICEDMWVSAPPAVAMVRAGATLIVNLSASSEGVGKSDYRRDLIRVNSARYTAAYAYVSAGDGESTSAVSFSGHTMVAENGEILAEQKPYEGKGQTLYTEIDVSDLMAERRTSTTFCANLSAENVPFSLDLCETALTRPVDAHPFVPADEGARAKRAAEVVAIQTHGLRTRLEKVKPETVQIGVSGGLDSTLALLIAVRAADELGWQRDRIHAITMPGFGTTARTKSNALSMCRALGVKLDTVPIANAVRVHFRDIGQDENQHDVTYENAQARERTQVLMDLANKENGLVLGTGDLSELALGWATYNGDQMSMYGVNAGVPKTLIRHLVAYFAEEAAKNGDKKLAKTLTDVLATPVSPELLPADGGEISQKTEDLVGPYELHDFFLWHLLRRMETPEKIARLAKIAFAGIYDGETVEKWLGVFLSRFARQQYKRSCSPDSVRVGSVSLSPAGGFEMPADTNFRPF